MRLFVLLIFLVHTSMMARSQTFYYERVAEVKNGIKISASGDGHFITFTSKGCYDSDSKGFTEDFGFREYKSTSNNIQTYYGESYFGNAYYYFNSDRSRLNIKKESDGTVYVYVKCAAPAGLTKSTRKKTTDMSHPSPTPQVIAVPGSSAIPYPVTPATTHPRRCAGCNGTGLCSMCKGKGWYKNAYDTKVYSCPSCHGSGRCGVCHGKGYFN